MLTDLIYHSYFNGFNFTLIVIIKVYNFVSISKNYFVILIKINKIFWWNYILFRRKNGNFVSFIFSNKILFNY